MLGYWKYHKNKLTFIIVFFLLGYSFRRDIYNSCVRYEVKEAVPIYTLRDDFWLKKTDDFVRSSHYQSVEDLNKDVLKLVTESLYFSATQQFEDPNDARRDDKAHCVGYAGLHAAILKHVFDNTYYFDASVRHLRGEIYFFGMRVTGLGDITFLKDHNYVEILDDDTASRLYSDASVFEMLSVSFVEARD